ncbi:F0F1 ATP synthase subunit B' [Alkalinema pantanalense CENA528]|uniref:F0F1 ATP synthase subunit B' n=1 Tax=Alkalinema pantanalense TaxID=1620705 RepID=UPI003D6EC66D
MFDFDATLPLMAVQFILLMVILNAIFFKPLTKVVEDRAELIRTSQTGAKEGLEKVNAITQQYEKELADSRRQYQAIIAKAQAEAQKIADDQIAAAQAEAIAQREQATKALDAEKATAMAALEQQVDALSQEILNKLLVGV